MDAGSPPNTTSDDRPLRCPACGTMNRADARWCSNCAQPLNSVAQTPPQETTTPIPTPPAAPSTPPPPTAPAAPPPPAPERPAPPVESPPAPERPAPPVESPPGAEPPATPVERPSAPERPTTPIERPTVRERPAPPAPTPPPAPSTTPPPPPRPVSTPTPSAPAAPSREAPATRVAPPPPPRPTTPPRAPGARGNPAPILALTTAIFFITTVLFGIMALAPSKAPIKTKSVQRAAESGVQEQIRSVATRFTTNLVTFNYQTIDSDVKRLEGDTTSSFAGQFQEPLHGTLDGFKAQVKRNQTVSTGDVKGTSVTSQDADTATVLVVVLQTAHNRTTAQNSAFRVLELTLIKASGGWKVDKVGNPSSAGA